MMTLSEFAKRMWKTQHGDKTPEQVEQEYEAKRSAEDREFLADLPFKAKDPVKP